MGVWFDAVMRQEHQRLESSDKKLRDLQQNINRFLNALGEWAGPCECVEDFETPAKPDCEECAGSGWNLGSIEVNKAAALMEQQLSDSFK